MDKKLYRNTNEKIIAGVCSGLAEYLNIDHPNKTIAYRRGKAVLLLNFHPQQSLQDYFLPLKDEGAYEVILSTDDSTFGGQNRVSKTYVYHTEKDKDGRLGIRIYIPSRCAVVLRKK